MAAAPRWRETGRIMLTGRDGTTYEAAIDEGERSLSGQGGRTPGR
jgi:hypothetical protein